MGFTTSGRPLETVQLTTPELSGAIPERIKVSREPTGSSLPCRMTASPGRSWLAFQAGRYSPSSTDASQKMDHKSRRPWPTTLGWYFHSDLAELALCAPVRRSVRQRRNGAQTVRVVVTRRGRPQHGKRFIQLKPLRVASNNRTTPIRLGDDRCHARTLTSSNKWSSKQTHR